MTGSEADNIVLDPEISRWVLFPIMLVMLLIGILRHYITLLVARSSKPQKHTDLLELRESLSVWRSIALRRNAVQLPLGAVLARRKYFIDAFSSGEFLKDKPASQKALETNGADKNGEQNSETPEVPQGPDPAQMEAMMDGMKKNMLMIIPQTLIMTMITYFFSGFLLTRLPFPLTVRFKSMLQSGIMTPDLDASWVSSLSWYFLNLFGLNPMFRLILGQDNAAGNASDLTAMNPLAASSMAAATGPTTVSDIQLPDFPQKGMAGMPGSQATYEKTYQSEKEFLELLDVSESRPWVCEGVEDRVAKLLRTMNRQ